MKQTYKPAKSREKLALTVGQQRQLVDMAEGKTKALLVLMLSTGMHPAILSDKNSKGRRGTYQLQWSDDYYMFLRTKTLKKIRGAWSPAMKEPLMLENLYRCRRRTPQRYWQMLNELGKECKISGLCPLQLRHTYFVNRARLGVNAWNISQGAKTSIDTINDFYMLGSNEMKQLSDEDTTWLKWLMGD